LICWCRGISVKRKGKTGWDEMDHKRRNLGGRVLACAFENVRTGWDESMGPYMLVCTFAEPRVMNAIVI